ncbi:MAG: hypothetical protein GY938_10590, partial [Ketobacter sp.]|nr:hypothetical protein [Ketobacter sp.]
MDWVVTHVIQQATPLDPEPNWAVRHAEAHKDSYALARCRERNIEFVPLAIDTFGGFGGVALNAIRRAVLEGRFGRDHDRNISEPNYMMRLSVAALRGVAYQLLRRGAMAEMPEPVPGLFDSILPEWGARAFADDLPNVPETADAPPAIPVPPANPPPLPFLDPPIPVHPPAAGPPCFVHILTRSNPRSGA